MSKKPNKISTITAVELSELTALTERHLREVAKLGFFPSPNRGVYEDRDATISGMFRYLRSLNDETKKEESKARAELNKARTRAIMRSEKLNEGEFASLYWIDETVRGRFADGVKDLEGRMDTLIQLVGTQVGNPHHSLMKLTEYNSPLYKEIWAEVERAKECIKDLLNDDLKGLRIALGHIEAFILHDLRQGEVESSENIMRKVDARIDEAGKKLFFGLNPSAPQGWDEWITVYGGLGFSAREQWHKAVKQQK